MKTAKKNMKKLSTQSLKKKKGGEVGAVASALNSGSAGGIYVTMWNGAIAQALAGYKY
jgi:hypothetical protein